MQEQLPRPCGRVRPCRVYSRRRLTTDKWERVGPWLPNLVLNEWGAIVTTLLANGLQNYRIGGMYIEFQNTDAPVTVPTFDRTPSSGIAYYNSLSMSADTDYLRVPLVAATISTSDPVNYPNNNQVTFFAQTTGVLGVNGKPFSNTVNSTIYGGALVSMVSPDDATQDLILSRFYFSVENQQPKLPTSQVGLEWELTLL